MRTPLRLYLGFEAIRLAVWAGFFLWLAQSRFADGTGPEASIPSALASMFLAFPYGLIAEAVTGAPPRVDLGLSPVFRVPLGACLVWLACTALLATWFARRSRA